jgi:hypothetical protein
MAKFRGGLIVLAAVALLGGPAKADIIYQDSVAPNLQNIVGALGMDFTVNQSIQVTALGAFDNGVNAYLAGSAGTGVTVGIFNVNTGMLVGTSVFFQAGGSYDQIGGDAFQSVNPFVLGPGTYSIVSLNDSNYNTMGAPNLFQVTDNLNGAISFVGGGRYGTLSFELPPTIDGGPPNRYDAGTFAATALAVPAPVAGSGPMMIVGLLCLGFMAYRRKVKASIDGRLNHGQPV